MQRGGVCINMKINKNTGRNSPFLMPLACRVLHIGLVLIYASVWYLLYQIDTHAPLSPGTAAYYGGLLEYPLASLALLTGAVLLFDRAERVG